ncbi:MAG: DUF1566 domain-containing protein, partial [Nitrospinae bacterium]|nr:DUF1566 domain-containing protein [Nitrospinota bacterium]
MKKFTFLVVALFFAAAATTAHAGSVQLPETGQTTSYATGDDGNLLRGVAWPSPRFTDKGDGTVIDNLTGLVWLKDANCIMTNYTTYDTDGAVTWQKALDFVNGINSGTYSNCGAGKTDWRLPNRKELRSIVDYSKPTLATFPALPTGHPFIHVLIFSFWSGTSYYFSADNAWYVDMGFGDTSYQSKSLQSYVWPVRYPDISAPSGASISINGGAASTSSTSVTLSLSATDNMGVTGYYVSETSTVPLASATGWVALNSVTSCSGSVSFTMSGGDGTKTVYAWFKDADGNVSASASDTITLDTTAPSGAAISINSGAASTSSTSVTLSLS